MRHATALFLVAAGILNGCEAFEPAGQRESQDVVTRSPEWDSLDIIDVAVLHPAVPSPDAFLGAALRNAARRHLIEAKRYSVPASEYVDGIVGSRYDAPSPEHLVEPLGADAALVIYLEIWDTRELLPRGRCYASGRVALYNPAGAIWERRFADWTRLAPVNVTASNRSEIEAQMLGALASELLGPLPPKRLQ